MIIRSLLRRPGTLKTFVGAPTQRIVSPIPSRSVHNLPLLTNHDFIRKNGIKGLFSPQGFSIAYDQYQGYLMEQLDSHVQGTPDQNTKPQDLVIKWARNPTLAYEFNVASAAFNNKFFFDGLSSDPTIKTQPTSELISLIRNDFSSLETLKVELTVTAAAMFGPGFVWLVQVNNDHNTQLRILPTYLAGSPLSGAHYRRQEHNLSTENPDSYQNLNPAGGFGPASQQQKSIQPKKPLGGVDITPLLCVNTWEHVWLHDFGVKGKLNYLEAWWKHINWDVVQNKVTFPSKSQSNNKVPRANFAQ